MFSRSCVTHTIERNAFKFEYTVSTISKRISANIIFHQGGRTRFAPTMNCTNGGYTTLGHKYFFRFANCLHEKGTVAHRIYMQYKFVSHAGM